MNITLADCLCPVKFILYLLLLVNASFLVVLMVLNFAGLFLSANVTITQLGCGKLSVSRKSSKQARSEERGKGKPSCC